MYLWISPALWSNSCVNEIKSDTVLRCTLPCQRDLCNFYNQLCSTYVMIKMPSYASCSFVAAVYCTKGHSGIKNKCKNKMQINIYIYSSLVIAKVALDLSRMISLSDRAALTAQSHPYGLGNVTVHVQHSTVHTSWWSHRDKKRKTGKHIYRQRWGVGW